MYQQATAPLTIGGVLDNGFKLFRECFSKVFLFALAGALVIAPINLLGPYFQNNVPGPGILATVVCAIIVAAIFAGVIYGALVARMDSVARAAPLSVGEALAIGLRRLPAMFVCGLAVGIVVVVGLLLLLIPGLIFMIWFAFAPAAVIIERIGPFASLSYSRALVRGHWWRTAALLTIVGIIVIVIYFVLVIALSVLVVSNPGTFADGQAPWYIQLVFVPLLSGIVTPLTYSFVLSIYYDLKMRLEGGDLAARIAATA